MTLARRRNASSLCAALLLAACSSTATSENIPGHDAGTSSSGSSSSGSSSSGSGSSSGDAGQGSDGSGSSSGGDASGSTSGSSSGGLQGDSGNPGFGGPDAGTYDFGCGGNTACSLSQVCCAHPGTTTTYTCDPIASCPGNDQVTCDGPDECGGSTPICCGVDKPTGTGVYPNCQPAAVGTSCTSAAACPTHIATNCTDTSTVVLCHLPADCKADPAHPKCCTFAASGASLTFCTDAVTAGLGGATCH